MVTVAVESFITVPKGDEKADEKASPFHIENNFFRYVTINISQGFEFSFVSSK